MARKKVHKYSNHHVPPKSCGGTEKIYVRHDKHMAYHLLFGNAPDLQTCIKILASEWWGRHDLATWWVDDPLTSKIDDE